MTERHDEEHERFIESLVVGERELDLDARARLERCATCAREWRELSALGADLDRQGRDEFELRSEALSAPAQADTDALLETFAASVRPTAVRRSRRPIVIALVAAAAIVASVFLWTTFSHTGSLEKRTPVYLSADGVDQASPRGETPSFGTFGARFEHGSNDRFEILVLVPDGSGTVIAEQHDLLEPTFTWEPEIVKAWGRAHVAWELWMIDSNRKRHNLVRTEAWLTPRD